MGLFSFLSGTAVQGREGVEILDVADFKSATAKKDVQLIDVRTPREYHSGHISDALNMDVFQQSTFRTTANELDKKKPVYLYCQSGNRSQKAARILKKMGFDQIYDLKGGYRSWR